VGVVIGPAQRVLFMRHVYSKKPGSAWAGHALPVCTYVSTRPPLSSWRGSVPAHVDRVQIFRS
jgi:hypothetical protein